MSNFGEGIAKALIEKKMAPGNFKPQDLINLSQADPIVAGWISLWLQGQMVWVEMLESCYENMRVTIDAQISSSDLAQHPETLAGLKGYVQLLEEFDKREDGDDSEDLSPLEEERRKIHRIVLATQVKNVVFAALLDVIQKTPPPIVKDVNDTNL